MEQLLQSHQATFSDLPGLTDRTLISIDTGDSPPVVSSAYRIPYTHIKEIKEEVADLQRAGLVTTSTSEWASPIVHVKKKDGSRRLCVDFKKVNKVTKADPYPMPQIESMIDELADAKYISTLDLTKGYWQVPVDPASRNRTAFILPFGKFEFTVMPFGLAGAPAVFQRLMDSLFQDLSGRVAAYMDDIVVYSTSWDDHLLHVNEALTRLKNVGLTLKLNKCHFGMSSCLYLGHEVGNSKVKPLEAKIAAIQSFKKPVTKKDVQAFLGLTGYYRRFIPNFASVAAPLTDATCKENPERIQWTLAETTSFERLKQALASRPVLQGPNFTKPFCLQTDASDYGIGVVLSQRDDDGTYQPIAFYSKKLNKAERRYAVIERECLAIVRAIDHFSVYLTGVEFSVETDHAPLQYLSSKKNTGRRLTRWALALQPYTFTITHRPGTQNGNTDGLSRQAWPDSPANSDGSDDSDSDPDEEPSGYFMPTGGGGSVMDP